MRSVHTPLTNDRTGAASDAAVNVPSAWAVTSLSSVISDVTVTSCPYACAISTAVSEYIALGASGRLENPNPADAAAAGAAAARPLGTTATATNASVTRAADRQRGRAGTDQMAAQDTMTNPRVIENRMRDAKYVTYLFVGQ